MPDTRPGPVLGLLLAAGAGRRMGVPKALVHDADGGSLLLGALDALREGGCRTVTVVLGAEAERAEELLAGGDVHRGSVRVVHADDWAEGMGASLRAGLRAAQGGARDHEGADVPSSALVTLVDLPDVGADVVRRLLEQLPHGPEVLGRAGYGGTPGHPVLIGRDHWAGVVESARGDRGARDYLREHPPVLVECGDLATGEDVDTPEQLG